MSYNDYGAIVDVPVDKPPLDTSASTAFLSQEQEESNDWRLFALILMVFQAYNFAHEAICNGDRCLLPSPSHPSASSPTHSFRQLILLILFATVVDYSPITFSTENDIQYMPVVRYA